MKRIALAALLSLLAAGAGAEPMKCIDAKGKVRYIDSSLIGTEKCEAVKDATNVVPPQSAPAVRENRETRPRPQPRPQASPNPAAQNEASLAEAEERLAEARKKLAEQEAIRLGGERNFSRVQERLQPFQETVEQAQKEVEQLRRNSR